MLRDKISEIMTQRLVTIGQSRPVGEAVSLMAEKNIGSIIVEEDGKVVGILTERDILGKMSTGVRLSDVPVSKLMTRHVVTAPPNTRIIDAAGILIENGFRRLPVVADGHLVGLVTETDLTFEMNSPHVSGDVAQYMSSKVHTIGTRASVVEAVDNMMEHNMGSSLVVDDEGNVCGIVTERDILRSIVARDRDPEGVSVDELMSQEIVSVGPDTHVSHACHLIYYYGIRRFPVLDQKESLLGIITERDLLRALKASHEKGL